MNAPRRCRLPGRRPRCCWALGLACCWSGGAWSAAHGSADTPSTRPASSGGCVPAALPTCHGVGHQQVSSPAAPVGEEEVDDLVAPPGGLQAGRGGGRPDHDRRRGGSGLGHGRTGRRSAGRLATRPCGPQGEAEQQPDSQGPRQGKEQPRPRWPPWCPQRGAWLWPLTGHRQRHGGWRIGPVWLEQRHESPLDSAGLLRGGWVDLGCRRSPGFQACPPPEEPPERFDLAF
jgi:hypothetical protein